MVLDPFMGSGSTCVAAAELGRRYYGIELNEKYHKIAEKRINEINSK
jgi:site-specific DNA-methyltransferase (adenine-specific)